MTSIPDGKVTGWDTENFIYLIFYLKAICLSCDWPTTLNFQISSSQEKLFIIRSCHLLEKSKRPFKD